MLKSLPVAEAGWLWRIGDKVRCCNWGGYTQGSDGDFALFSWEAYSNFRTHTPEFEDLAALQAGNAPLGVRRAGCTGTGGHPQWGICVREFFQDLWRARTVDWPPFDRRGR